MITVAALSPSLDISYLVPQLRLGAIHRPTEVHRVAGGKPLNLARAAHTVGAQVSAVAVLGGPTGSFIEQALADAGIAVRVVGSDRETRTCVSIASGDRDDLTEVYPYAPEVAPATWQQFCAGLVDELQRRPGWLAINGSTPRGLAGSDLADLVATGHRVGVRVAVDTHGPALQAAVGASPDLVKINRYEAADLLDQVAADLDLAEACRRIADRTGGDVIITDGGSGAVGRAGDGRLVSIVPPAHVVGRFPVGSGDSFLGGWLAAVEDGADPLDALRLAIGCGTANALQPGPGRLDASVARQIADRLEPRMIS